MSKLRKWFGNSEGFIPVSILMGFIIGALVLEVAGYNPFAAYGAMLEGIFGKPKYLMQTVINGTPIILTGLSVVFAFKTGLFNIGAEGQFIVGSITAAAVGYFFHLPPVIHVLVVMTAAAVASGVWGMIVGYLKARFGVNEVITAIMLNWIAFYLQNFLINLQGFKKPESESSFDIQQSASTIVLEKWKQSGDGIQWLNSHPVLKDIFKTDLNLGIVFAILLIFLIWFILNKTTLGFSLRTVGSSRYAAEYCGINVNRSIIVSMMIAGAIAGIAGSLQVMGVYHRISILASMEGFGLDGISVALIANNSPAGCLFAGLLYSGLKYGGSKIQQVMGAPSEIINIMIGIIVFFTAMPMLIKKAKEYMKRKRGAEVV